jgi:hypothetical protein
MPGVGGAAFGFMLQYRCSSPNHDGLQVAKPNLQTVFKKPGAYIGPSFARSRTTSWKTLRFFLTPPGEVGFGEFEACNRANWHRGRSTLCRSRSARLPRADEREWVGQEPHCRVSDLLEQRDAGDPRHCEIGNRLAA